MSISIVCFPENSSIRAESNKRWETSQTGVAVNRRSRSVNLDGITASAENVPCFIMRLCNDKWQTEGCGVRRQTEGIRGGSGAEMKTDLMGINRVRQGDGLCCCMTPRGGIGVRSPADVLVHVLSSSQL